MIRSTHKGLINNCYCISNRVLLQYRYFSNVNENSKNIETGSTTATTPTTTTTTTTTTTKTTGHECDPNSKWTMGAIGYIHCPPYERKFGVPKQSTINNEIFP